MNARMMLTIALTFLTVGSMAPVLARVATSPIATPPAMKRTVAELTSSGTAAAHILEKRSTSSGIELDVALYDLQSGRTIGDYAPPYTPPSEDYRALWKDYVIRSLQIPAQAEDINVLEQRSLNDESYAIAFVLDHSPSMTVPRALRMQRAIQHALSLFDEHDFVTITKFTGRVNTEVPLTNQRADYIDKFKVDGLNLRSDGTAIYDASMAALQQLATSRQDVKRVMIVFTDGEDNASSATMQDVIAKATETGTQVFAVTYGVSNGDALEEIAKKTGGKVQRLSDVYDFDRVFLGLYNGLRHTYRVAIRSRDPQAPEDIVSAITTIHLNGSGTVHSRDIIEMLPKSNVEIPNSSQTQEALILNMDVQYMNEADISPADVAALDSVATVLIQRRDLALEITQAADASTSNQDDVELAMRRTQAIRDLLVKRGVPSARVHSTGSSRQIVNPSAKRTTLILSKL